MLLPLLSDTLMNKNAMQVIEGEEMNHAGGAVDLIARGSGATQARKRAGGLVVHCQRWGGWIRDRLALLLGATGNVQPHQHWTQMGTSLRTSLSHYLLHPPQATAVQSLP